MARTNKAVYTPLFTFQYGSIQIFEFHILHFLSKWFTFQYGSIQINALEWAHQSRQDLHSNMVLFKLFLLNSLHTHICLYIPIWFYSNLLLRLLIYKWYTLHSNMVLFKFVRISIMRINLSIFTFQYGSIQIKT